MGSEPTWAALRRWHRDERQRWLGVAARADVHDAALTEMTRIRRAARRKAKPRKDRR